MNKIFPLLFFVLFVLVGCDSTPRLKPLPEAAVVLAFGDSLTYGTGAEEGESYPEVLERLIGNRVINAGVPGELTSDGVQRLPGVLAEVRPDLVILCHGGNDILQRRGAEELEANIRKMVELSLQSGAQVLLIGVPQPSMVLRTIPLYVRTSWDMKVPLEEHLLPDILRENSLKSDTIHPNAAGYAVFAERIAERLRSAKR
ncbi:arylesterase [Geoalkalibacter sp.]|uniref:arylesterase n=1 Tax=Geoalkalibacter sp. TaxID=3041440 RepID=UPI00272E2523|nr:arylesterase [Geoalkalibacter sp.]